jgi:2'-5' RNA ligase
VPAEADSTEQIAERPATARVFFALWPPVALAEQLAATARTAAGQFGGRPTRQETIHLTLAFLGEVDASRLPEIVRIARRIEAADFDLQIDHLAFWAHKRLLWAGCSAVPPALRQLVEDLQRNLAQAAYPPATGGHGFTPHLSLVRRVPVASAPPAVYPLATLTMPDWPCRGFVLVRSQGSSLGSDYLIIDEFPLACRD